MEGLTLEKRQLCDIQGRLFELALKAGLDCPSFIESFMNSKAAAALDDVYDRLQWAGEEYILEEHTVSGRLLEVLYIPPGYVHNIVNIGEDDLITVIWANENFDKERPDTYYEEV